nr:putative UPF0481 protein At3g02645 [Tanacetum cinerariifolium]
MALIDPSLSSYPKRQWADEISDILNHQLEIEVETPPPVVSIFKVPETMTTQKPEAYEPQQIGLGPYHHLRPLPYKKMEQKKLAAMRRVLKDDHKIEDFKLCVLDKVRKLVPIVRDCYNMFLESDEDSLSWVFAIDGIFLLDLFRSYDTGMGQEKNADQLPQKTASDEAPCTSSMQQRTEEAVSSEIQPCIAQIPHKTASDESVTPIYHVIEDVETLQPISTKVEIDEAPCTSKNQIPFMVLKEIDDALHLSSAGKRLGKILDFTLGKSNFLNSSLLSILFYFISSRTNEFEDWVKLSDPKQAIRGRHPMLIIVVVLEKREAEVEFKYNKDCVRLELEVTELEEMLERGDYVAQQPVDCSLANVVVRLILAKTRYRMDGSKRGAIPMQVDCHLYKSQCAESKDDKARMQNVPYASVVGSIMYAVRCTRPDVAFAQNITSRFQQSPGEAHWTAVKNILKYLRRTKDMFLVYGGNSDAKLQVKCYCDAGFETDRDDTKS